MRKKIFSVLLFCICLSAEETFFLKAIIITKEHENLECENTKGVFVPDHFTKKEKLISLLHPYLEEKELVLRDLYAIRDIVQKNVNDTHVSIPSQNIAESQVLFLKIDEYMLGNVCVRGTKYFNERKLVNSLSLKPDEPISMKSLSRDLQWVNRNPFRQVDAVFLPTDQKEILDLELLTEDRFPLRAFSGVDNTGIPESGRTHWYFGFNWGNVFGLGHLFTYQFTMGYDIGKFWANTLQYTAPLSWKHTLMIYGGFSRIAADLDESGMKTRGYSGQASLRYEIPFRTSFLQELIWGFDYKRTNTNLRQFGELFFDKSVNLTQLMLGYNLGYENLYLELSSTWEIFYSPGKWLSDQSDERYRELRMGARNDYVYGRAHLRIEYFMSRFFSWNFLFRGQLSSANLLSSEQFGLGGFSTVRGYNEREVNVDNAFLATGEFKTKPIGLLNLLSSNIDDQLILLAFVDYAYGRNHELFLGEKKNNNLLGVGPGCRYFIIPNLTARIDLGYKIFEPEENEDSGRWRFYFGITGSY